MKSDDIDTDAQPLAELILAIDYTVGDLKFLRHKLLTGSVLDPDELDFLLTLHDRRAKQAIEQGVQP